MTKCPFLGSIYETKVNCMAKNYRNLEYVEFNSKQECHEHTGRICFDRFLDCEKYQKFYIDFMTQVEPETGPFKIKYKTCLSCCNSSGYTGLPKGYDGQQWCFCQKWQQPMQHDGACSWINRHPDWPFEVKERNKSMSNTIQLIKIDEISPHINNPRKDLGDLTELADSIRVWGILQNLTVVPDHDWYNSGTGKFEKYIAVIGHRRLAAARLANLTEVPCIISDMSPREQVATMLLENMQRNDLTVYEQAQGFQMMLNFGDSIDDIAEATGFSKSTVRHRVKLLELDQDKFKKATEQGGTLQDYIELEKIKNVKTRNKVLEEIGTSNFKWKLDQAIDEEAKPERKKALLEELNKFAKPIATNKTNSLSYVAGFYGFKMDNYKKPKDYKSGEYFYVTDQNNITLYKKEPKTQQKKLTEEEKSFRDREAQLKELTAQAYESRFTFIKDFTAAKKVREIIITALVKNAFDYSRAEPDTVLKLLDIEKPADAANRYISSQEYWGLISGLYDIQPERVLLILAYGRLADSKTDNYYHARSWENKIKYQENEKLDGIYDLLIELGYELSDEERALRDGTHELFDTEVSS